MRVCPVLRPLTHPEQQHMAEVSWAMQLAAALQVEAVLVACGYVTLYQQ